MVFLPMAVGSVRQHSPRTGNCALCGRTLHSGSDLAPIDTGQRSDIQRVGWMDRSDTHHVLHDGDGFRDGLNPSEPIKIKTVQEIVLHKWQRLVRALGALAFLCTFCGLMGQSAYADVSGSPLGMGPG